MWRTAFLTALFIGGGFISLYSLTLGLAVWTDEDARRLAVARQPLSLPAAEVDGPDLSSTPLDALLRQPGQITIVDFIYTHCTTVCLTLSTTFRALQDDLLAGGDQPGNDGVQLLSVSFDGGRDTPQVLTRYAKHWGADADRWRFARVLDLDEQDALLERLGVVVIPDGKGNYEHNAALLIFDDAARLVRIFDMEDRQLALNYARHLAQQRLDEARR